jgi:hypothetical protein
MGESHGGRPALFALLIISLISACYRPVILPVLFLALFVRILFEATGNKGVFYGDGGRNRAALRCFSLFWTKMAHGSSPSGPCADRMTADAGRRRPPYPIASSSPIIRSITERPMLQNAGSRASRPKGARSCE